MRRRHRNDTLPQPERSTVDTLTGKQRPFVERYLTHFNATRAAREAGYSNPDKAGPRNLKVPKIAEAVETALAEVVMSRNEVLRLLSSQARAEHMNYLKVATLATFDDAEEDRHPGRIYITNSLYYDIAAMIADGKQHLIKTIRTIKDSTPTLDFPDSQTALIWLGKHYKLFTDIVQSDRDAELDDALDAISQNAKIDL
jgi:phage terminase small subunit